MRVPYTIPRNVFEAYRCSQQTLLLPREQGRTIRPEDETWDDAMVPELKILALRVLVQQWRKYPIFESLPTCEDRDTLLEMLPTDLPLELMIRRIPHECYWERAAKDRWQHNNVEDHGDSWRRLYCERHFTEFLEKLESSYFSEQRDTCDELIKLVREHIRTLKIRSLIPCKYPFEWSGEDDEDRCTTKEFPVDHIPLNHVLPKLPFLRELHINFGMIYRNDGFEWRDFEFSVQDCLNLGRGIKDCGHLVKFSLTRSNLDQPRVAALLQGVAVNNRIEEIDLSHCKLGDAGAHAVGEFLTTHRRLKILHLANNKIGASGVAGLVHGLLKEDAVPLRHLNLRLNPLLDAGGGHVCALLLRHRRLEVLNVSGCGFGTEAGIGVAEVIGSGYMRIPLLEIDISNNDLGPNAGEIFEMAVKSCPAIVGLDVRLCNFSKDSEYSIGESVNRNKDERKTEKIKAFMARRSTVAIPLRAKSLVPPSEFSDLQQPGATLHDVTSSLRNMRLYGAEDGAGGTVLFSGVQDGGSYRKSMLKSSGSRSIGSSRSGLRLIGSYTGMQSAGQFSKAGILSAAQLVTSTGKQLAEKQKSLTYVKSKLDV